MACNFRCIYNDLKCTCVAFYQVHPPPAPPHLTPNHRQLEELQTGR